MDTHAKQKYKKFIEFVLAKDNFVKYLTDFTANDPGENIQEIKTEYYHEIAPSTRYLHTHAIVNIVHTGHYKYLVEDLRAFCEKVFGKRFHINLQAQKKMLLIKVAFV